MENGLYTKEELKKSARFKDRRDLVEALLKCGEEYEISEAEEIIENFLKGCV